MADRRVIARVVCLPRVCRELWSLMWSRMKPLEGRGWGLESVCWCEVWKFGSIQISFHVYVYVVLLIYLDLVLFYDGLFFSLIVCVYVFVCACKNLAMVKLKATWWWLSWPVHLPSQHQMILPNYFSYHIENIPFLSFITLVVVLPWRVYECNLPGSEGGNEERKGGRVWRREGKGGERRRRKREKERMKKGENRQRKMRNKGGKELGGERGEKKRKGKGINELRWPDSLFFSSFPCLAFSVPLLYYFVFPFH